ncbi:MULTISPECIES: response regulator [unclassified Lentimonas]|uniref:response regulator n=1 Tax=unclassified Lentimonas TaxID=2630993 RepID=UPI0013261FD0|nr:MULTISPECIES: response regulator [unclassified Lentimonas]CAA6694511.1 Unannotated [Lentimonas sp. CC19]CAA6697127.1 Unannotated [Lentimonas sp. CC10]CAA7069572.1 Unannotated [Lentimonas sp. CC11]
MNILFIEDENELREIGVAQLQHRYTVYPVSNLAEAREIMNNPAMPVHMVLADHRLPDGQGVEFVIEMKEQFPHCEYAIVSGCLTAENMEALEESEIPYFHKPLLYAKVVEAFRRKHLSKPLNKEEVAEELSVDSNDMDTATDVATDSVEAPSSELKKPKKKWFGLL